MTSRCSRIFFLSISKITSSFKYIPQALCVYQPTSVSKVVPYMLGFSLFTWTGFNQTPTAEDELIHTIKHCLLFIKKSEYQKAEQLLHVVLRQAQQMNHDMAITYIYDIMANLALEREEVEKAKSLFVSVAQRVMAQGATEDDLRVVHISVKLARISHLLKEYATAQIGYDWCLAKLNKELENNKSKDIIALLALAEDWYGRLLVDSNKLEEGVNYMISAFHRIKELEGIDKEQLVVQLNDIGTVYDSLGWSEKSIVYIKQAIDLGKNLSEMEDFGTMHINLGRVYMKKNMLEEARKNCGFGWRLGVLKNNKKVKNQAELCLSEVNKLLNSSYIIVLFPKISNRFLHTSYLNLQMIYQS